jgi:S1/P1 Nuclease
MDNTLGPESCTYPLLNQYVDPLDNPSTDCSYVDERDCKDGKCVVGAITNFTSQATCSSNFPDSTRTDALKFIVHFIGDLAQPLHACGRLQGGNGAKVLGMVFCNTVDGVSTNLHSAWDTAFPLKRIAENGGQASYTAYLLKQISNGAYRAQARSWVSAYPIDELNDNGNSKGVVDWAKDSDRLNCEVTSTNARLFGADLMPMRLRTLARLTILR